MMVAACSGDDTADTSAAAPFADTPTATDSSRVGPAKVNVPRVTGLSLERATKRLRARGLQVGTVSKRPSTKTKGTVLRQSDRNGSTLRDGSSVSLVVAKPLLLALPAAGFGLRLRGR